MRMGKRNFEWPHKWPNPGFISLNLDLTFTLPGLRSTEHTKCSWIVRIVCTAPMQVRSSIRTTLLPTSWSPCSASVRGRKREVRVPVLRKISSKCGVMWNSRWMNCLNLKILINFIYLFYFMVWCGVRLSFSFWIDEFCLISHYHGRNSHDLGAGDLNHKLWLNMCRLVFLSYDSYWEGGI